MNPLLGVAFGIAFLLVAAPASAQVAGAPAPPTKATAHSAAHAKAMAEMDHQLQRMLALHDRMMNAATTEERQRLMAEHRKVMQEGMGLMTRMLQSGQMTAGARSGAAVSGGTLVDSETSVQLLLRGIEILQTMQLMMMDQLGIVRAPKGSDAAPAK
ncbi:hypothetical protein BURK1_01517 [Burkholderiales bacterium]|nr:hypothetical protein BURK1_01517 [Burkholderiales bacterium]